MLEDVLEKKKKKKKKRKRKTGGAAEMRRMDYKLKNDKTERARGLGRKIKEEIGKGNEMTALRFHTEESHQASWSSSG